MRKNTGLSIKSSRTSKDRGFTLIELLVVIAIIGLLASVVTFAVNTARDKARIARSVADAKQLTTALELYYDAVGFYPPDVGRGWDPGFSAPLPSNPDTGQTDTPACPQCPSDWVTQVQAKWKGPYIARYPSNTSWGGEYDYNYWAAGASRYGCAIPPGIYIGIQGDSNNANTIPPAAEQKMVDQGNDSDGCVNGEAQVMLYKL